MNPIDLIPWVVALPSTLRPAAALFTAGAAILLVVLLTPTLLRMLIRGLVLLLSAFVWLEYKLTSTAPALRNTPLTTISGACCSLVEALAASSLGEMKSPLTLEKTPRRLFQWAATSAALAVIAPALVLWAAPASPPAFVVYDAASTWRNMEAEHGVEPVDQLTAHPLVPAPFVVSIDGQIHVLSKVDEWVGSRATVYGPITEDNPGGSFLGSAKFNKDGVAILETPTKQVPQGSILRVKIGGSLFAVIAQ